MRSLKSRNHLKNFHPSKRPPTKSSFMAREGDIDVVPTKFLEGKCELLLNLFFWKIGVRKSRKFFKRLKEEINMIFLGSRMCPEFLFKLFPVLNPPSQRRKSRKTRSRIQKLLRGNNARKSFNSDAVGFEILNDPTLVISNWPGFFNFFMIITIFRLGT